MRHLVLIAALICFLPATAAWSALPPSQPGDICTDGPQFRTDISGSSGLVTSIATRVNTVLTNAAKNLFQAIQKSSGFLDAGRAVLTLYIAIYGILFTFGMTQITVSDFVMRMIKIGVIVIILTPPSGGGPVPGSSASIWDFFNGWVVNFFNTTVDELINAVTGIAIGGSPMWGCPSSGSCPPLAAIDAAIAKAVSANMAVHLLATLFTSAYGALHAILMGLALWAFLGSILTAIWVYLMSMVLRALLFGVAPLFIICLLFQRTRHLFDGWLNQVVNACLQPILLFTFFAFFVVLVTTSIDRILEVPVCWTGVNESMRGTPVDMEYWRYAVEDSSTSTGFAPYGGAWDWGGTQGSSRIFPIDIMAVLVFLILAELGKRFNQVVLMIARDLAGASTDLSRMQGSLSDFFGGQGNKETGTLSRSLSGGKEGRAAAVQAATGEGSNVAQAAKGAATQVGSRPGGPTK